MNLTKTPGVILVGGLHVLLLVALMLSARVVSADHVERQPEDDVWIQWSVVPHEKKADLEAAKLEVPLDYDSFGGVTVVNNRTDRIRNVTLVAVPGDNIKVTLRETAPGHRPQETYAYWNEIRPKGGALVLMNMTAVRPTPGPFSLQFLVFFEDDEGRQMVAETTYTGDIGDPGAAISSFVESPPVIMWAIVMGVSAVSGAGVAVGTIAWVRRRRQG